MGMFRLRGCAGNWVTTRPPQTIPECSSTPHPPSSFVFELQKSRVAFVLISFLPSFIFIVLPHYLGFCSLLLSFIWRMFCVFTESFSLHLGSMGVDAYDGLFYIYW